MPWQATNVERERMRFVVQAEEGLFSMKELCARFGISRQAGYTLLKRYEEEGVSALRERSRAPGHSPQRIAEAIQALLLETRREHTDWGPRKVLDYLREERPELKLPAASTVGDLYTRHRLVEVKRRERRWPHPGRAPLRASAPNQVWTVDYKGEFLTGDGRRCYPLTMADAHTRFLLACDGLSSTAHASAQAVFERVFRTYGLPEVIRSDNGSPFASKAIAGLSRLSLWWTRLGIGHDRIQPGHPEQNGSHERMHRTLKRRTLRPVAADAVEQQDRFDDFREEYNHVRPHDGVGGQRPGKLYTRSARELPAQLPGPEYPAHFRVRRLRKNGILYFRDRSFFVSELLKGEDVGLEEIGDRVWSLYFYDLLLARLDERTWKLRG
jgi:putative transposase